MAPISKAGAKPPFERRNQVLGLDFESEDLMAMDSCELGEGGKRLEKLGLRM